MAESSKDQIAPKTDVVNPVAGVLRAAGYERKGLRWRRLWPDATGVVDLSRSRFGPQYYLELGVVIAGVEPAREGWFGTEKCHMWTRAERLLPVAERAWAESLLALDSGLGAEARARDLESLLVRTVIPYHLARSTIGGIRDVVTSVQGSELLRYGTRAFFGMPPAEPRP